MTAKFETVGPDYCTEHHGIREEDAFWCDFRDPDNPDHSCDTCEGTGSIPGNGRDEACPDCEEGMTHCELRPLGYMKAIA